MNLRIFTHPNYNDCEGQHVAVGKWVFMWDCHCGLRRFYVVRLIAYWLGNNWPPNLE